MSHSVFSYKQIRYIYLLLAYNVAYTFYFILAFSTCTPICNNLNSPFKFLYYLIFYIYILSNGHHNGNSRKKKRKNISIKTKRSRKKINIQSHTLNERCKKRQSHDMIAWNDEQSNRTQYTHNAHTHGEREKERRNEANLDNKQHFVIVFVSQVRSVLVVFCVLCMYIYLISFGVLFFLFVFSFFLFLGSFIAFHVVHRVRPI